LVNLNTTAEYEEFIKTTKIKSDDINV
jgi:hypothetical protein